jgi:hypothetical protein
MRLILPRRGTLLFMLLLMLLAKSRHGAWLKSVPQRFPPQLHARKE